MLNEEEEMSTTTINLGSGIRYAQIEDLQGMQESPPESPLWRVALKRIIAGVNSPEVEPYLFKLAMMAGVIACALALAGILALI